MEFVHSCIIVQLSEKAYKRRAICCKIREPNSRFILTIPICIIQWSEQAQLRENDLTAAFRPLRDRMLEAPDVSLGHLLAARKDLAVLEKTSSATVRKNTTSSLNKVCAWHAVELVLSQCCLLLVKCLMLYPNVIIIYHD